MLIHFKNFAHALELYNDIINATDDRAYIASATFNLDGYYVNLKATDSDDELFFILRSTGDSCIIYPQSAKYEGQHICFGSEPTTFDEIVKLINNFFYEVE